MVGLYGGNGLDGERGSPRRHPQLLPIPHNPTTVSIHNLAAGSGIAAFLGRRLRTKVRSGFQGKPRLKTQFPILLDLEFRVTSALQSALTSAPAAAVVPTDTILSAYPLHRRRK
ncbi:hypothetical protein R1flu_009172 [Riccia fluitans]|uniref:Uncharacterized protein n=1 Tax=Riccia fluitans TaxID=41844 RepID=A0ABD1Z260_9MARC